MPSPSIAGQPVGPIGFGMGGLTYPAKAPALDTAIAVLKAALDRGATCWNAGTNYGTPEWNSLHLLREYFTRYPADASRVVLSVKSCFSMASGPAVDAASVRDAVEHCLAVLDGRCRIAVFQAARLDPRVPVEETVGAIAEFVRAGRIGGVGLSECGAASIRRAAAVTPLAAVEVEVSLFERGIWGNGVAQACAELGVPIVAYSPLCRGFLTGRLRSFEDLPEGDFRHMFPRFGREAFEENVRLVREVEVIAKAKGCSVGQVALAWVCAQGNSLGVPVVPIPGAVGVARVEENTDLVSLSEIEMRQIDDILSRIEIKGGRAPPQFAHMLEG